MSERNRYSLWIVSRKSLFSLFIITSVLFIWSWFFVLHSANHGQLIGSLEGQEELLVQQVFDLYEQISNLGSLKPSKDVNMLFRQLVLTCTPPRPDLDVTKLGKKVEDMRSKLIRLCGEAEGLLESHFSTILSTHEHPIDHLHTFPYYNNYIKLSLLEYNLLSQHYHNTQNAPPRQVAFVGSGPLPMTSIILALNHLTTTTFHNYDIDASANANALGLVSSHPDLSKRMLFHTGDIMGVTTTLKDYDVVFLAALVGMDKEDKLRVIDHLAKHMNPGATLMARSAHGARAFLYPVINSSDLRGFEVLSVFHPTDDVINSVVVARKYPVPTNMQSSHGQGLAPNSALPLGSKVSTVEA